MAPGYPYMKRKKYKCYLVIKVTAIIMMWLGALALLYLVVLNTNQF